MARAALGATESELVVASPAGSYFVVKAWLPDDVLLLQQFSMPGYVPSVWTVPAGGGEARGIVEGTFLGLMQPP